MTMFFLSSHNNLTTTFILKIIAKPGYEILYLDSTFLVLIGFLHTSKKAFIFIGNA